MINVKPSGSGMSVEEMLEVAISYQNLVWGDDPSSLVNKLCSVIWFSTSEICRRLDDIKENTRTPL